MSLVVLPRQMVVTIAGVPRVGAKLFVYDAGTSNPRAAYTTAALSTPHANPVLSVSSGYFPAVYVDVDGGDYKLVVKDALDVTIYTEDDIPPSDLTSESVGRAFYPILPEEEAAGLTESALTQTYEYFNLLRYQCDPTGTNDNSDKWAAVVSLGSVIIPKGSFKVVTGASYTGAITIKGEGPASKILSDAAVITVAGGTGSVVKDFWLENITAPYLITRDPSNWAGVPTSGTSNGNGYQPTVNDADVWSGLTTGQKNQQIGPVIQITGSNITVSGISGRFVRIDLLDGSRNTVMNCNITGGKGVWGAIYFNNVNTSGMFNRALNNHVRYASFSGISFANNTDGIAYGNTVELCGESGIKTIGNDGGATSSHNCANMTIVANKCNRNYFDGIDGASTYPLSDATTTSHMFQGNECYGNGGTGMNADGRNNSYVGNKFWNNYTFGFWGYCSDSLISNNVAIDNNQQRNASQAEMLCGDTTTDGNLIIGNRIFSGAGQNSNAIYANGAHVIRDNYAEGSTFFFGNAGSIISMISGNVDTNTVAHEVSLPLRTRQDSTNYPQIYNEVTSKDEIGVEIFPRRHTMTNAAARISGAITSAVAGAEYGEAYVYAVRNGTLTKGLKIVTDSSRNMPYAVLRAPNSAVSDASVDAGAISFYLDEGGANLKVRVKYADGTTLKTGTLAVS